MRVAKFCDWKSRRFIEHPVNKLYPIEKIGAYRINDNETIINQRPRRKPATMGLRFIRYISATGGVLFTVYLLIFSNLLICYFL